MSLAIGANFAKAVSILNFSSVRSLFVDAFIGLQPCTEIDPSDINGTTISSKKTYSIYTSGRQSSASGTEGSFDLYTSKGDKIVTVYWDCPWAAGSKNVVQLRDVPTDWMVSNSPYNTAGAIGTVIIKFAQMVY